MTKTKVAILATVTVLLLGTWITDGFSLVISEVDLAYRAMTIAERWEQLYMHTRASCSGIVERIPARRERVM